MNLNNIIINDTKPKSLWQGIFGKGLWSEILKTKYIKKAYIEEWIRHEMKFEGSISWRLH